MFKALVITGKVIRVFNAAGDPPAEVSARLEEPGATLRDATADEFLEDYARRNNGLPDVTDPC